MSADEQRIAIAEWCGERLFVIHKPIRDPFGYYCEKAHGYTNLEHAWKVTEEVAKQYVGGRTTDADRVIMEPAPLPDYLNDLNAMHEAEELLIRSLGADTKYVKTLTEIASKQNTHYTPFRAAVTATAAQRAEALLRTIGKWTDSTLHTKG